MLAIFDQDLVKGNGRGDAHVLTIAEEEYPAEYAFVLRQLRDSMLLAHQVEHQQRRVERAEQERQARQRAETRIREPEALLRTRSAEDQDAERPPGDP